MALVYAPYRTNAIQLGREVTAGTEVAATHVWRGPFAGLVDEREIKVAEEHVGLLAPNHRTYGGTERCSLSMPATELTYEQVLHIAEAGIETVTPTDGGGPGPYTYTYDYPQDGTPVSIKTYTVEAFNANADNDGAQMRSSFVESFNISGSVADNALMMSANWVGHTHAQGGTQTGSLTPPAVEIARMSDCEFQLDDEGSTGTALASLVTDFSFDVTTGYKPVFANDSALFAAVKYVGSEITWSFTLELAQDGAGNPAVRDIRGDMDAHNLINLSILCPSSAGGSNGNFVIHTSGHYMSIGDYTDADGDTVVTVEGRSVLNTTDNRYFQIIVVNDYSAVP